MNRLSTLALVASLALAAPAFAQSPASLASNPFLMMDAAKADAAAAEEAAKMTPKQPIMAPDSSKTKSMKKSKRTTTKSTSKKTSSKPAVKKESAGSTPAHKDPAQQSLTDEKHKKDHHK